ncbi:VpaChn25_0724 family phage protein [Aliihoeflea sp. PC F10.4]
MNDPFVTEARLAILGELNKQPDGRLNEVILDNALTSLGFGRSREWLRTQLRKMEELGAVRLTEAGPVLVVAITSTGLEHFERRSNIDGIAARSRGN